MLFAWVALCGLVHTIAQYAAGPSAAWVRGILMAVYDLLLVGWIFQTDRQAAAGLRGVSIENRWDLLSPLILIVFPLYNVVSGAGYTMAAPLVLQMLGAAFAEEIFFRGFLLSYLRRLGPLMGILLTSLVFSLMHSINFVSNGDGAYVWLQLLSSFPISVCYCAITIRTGSILPAVGAHFLTNITGSGTLGSGYSLLGLWGCIAVYALWGTMLCLDNRNGKRR